MVHVMLTVLLLTNIVGASDIHTGVPVTGIEGLGPPRFQTVDTADGRCAGPFASSSHPRPRTPIAGWPAS